MFVLQMSLDNSYSTLRSDIGCALCCYLPIWLVLPYLHTGSIVATTFQLVITLFQFVIPLV